MAETIDNLLCYGGTGDDVVTDRCSLIGTSFVETILVASMMTL